eukprot:7394193-Lingulodinium_polyedra.AAC.1
MPGQVPRPRPRGRTQPYRSAPIETRAQRARRRRTFCRRAQPRTLSLLRRAHGGLALHGSPA